MSDEEWRARVVAAARGWVGTPYHHQASVKGVGADCLGLVRGVWRDVYGHDAETPPNYSADWAETGGRETMLEAAARHFAMHPGESLRAGDVVVFRLRTATVAKHAGIVVSATSFVHAMEGGVAAEVPLTPWWRRRVAGVFSFIAPDACARLSVIGAERSE